MRIRDAIADSFGTVIGRVRFALLARFLWLRSRLEVRNEIHTNGEQDIQEAVLRRIKKRVSGTIFDVGANTGQWTSSLLTIADRVGISNGGLNLHLFEPAPEAADALEANLKTLPSRVDAVVNRVAVASESGDRNFHIVDPTAGKNSLFQSSTAVRESVKVPCVTLDHYCRENRINQVDLCTIDAEGADCLVLEGGIESLKEGVFRCVQFEYNHRWIYSRRYLRDVFEIIAPLGLQVGKFTTRGVEKYEAWDPELECFQEGNYLLTNEIESLGLPVLEWWHAVSE